MVYYLFEFIISIIDVLVIHLYLNTFFHIKRINSNILYWSWLFILELSSIPISTLFYGDITILKQIVLVTTTFITIFLMSLAYKSSFKHRLLISIIYIFLAGLCEDVPGSIIIYISNKYSHLSMEQIELIVQAQYSFSFILLLSVIKIIYNRNINPTTIKYNISLLITPFLSLIIVGDTSIILTPDTTYKLSVIIKYICLFLINIINFILLDNFYTIHNLEEEKKFMDHQILYQSNKYTQISAAYRNTRSILHDTKKHFVYLRECLNNNESKSGIMYIDRTINEMESIYNKVNTGNLVIDSFVSNHIKLAEQEGINCTTELNVDSSLIQIDDYDLSIILGNLLDNALNGCRNSRNSVEGYIIIKIITNPKSLSINIINSYSPDSRIVNDDAGYSLYHGYGLENVRNKVKKYYGSYDFIQSDNCFDAAIKIPFVN